MFREMMIVAISFLVLIICVRALDRRFDYNVETVSPSNWGETFSRKSSTTVGLVRRGYNDVSSDNLRRYCVKSHNSSVYGS